MHNKECFEGGTSKQGEGGRNPPNPPLKKSGDKNLLSLDDAEVELFDFRVVIS